MRNESEKGLPVVGVDNGYLWSRLVWTKNSRVGAAMGPQETRPDGQGQRAEHLAGYPVVGRSSQPATGVHQKRTSRPGSVVKFRDCKDVLQSRRRLIDQSLTTAHATNERKSAMRDDAAGAKRPEESKRRKERQDWTWSWARGAEALEEQIRGAAKSTHLEEHEERPKTQGCRVCKTLPKADSSSLHTVTRCDSGEMRSETSEVAEVFCPGRLAASCSLFDMLPQVLNLRSGWSLNEAAGASQVLDDIGGSKANGCDRQLTTVVEVSGGTCQTWRPGKVGDRMTCALYILCEGAPLAV